MPRFRVIAGTHDDDGTLYGPDQPAGAIFESDLELDRMFSNKFIRLGSKTKKGRDTTHEADEGGGTRVMDADQLGERIKRKSKLLQKKHGGKKMKGKRRPEDEPLTDEEVEEAESFDEDDLEDESFTDVSVAGALGKKTRQARVIEDDEDDEPDDSSEDEEDEEEVNVSVGDDDESSDDEEDEAPRRKKVKKSGSKKSKKK